MIWNPCPLFRFIYQRTWHRDALWSNKLKKNLWFSNKHLNTIIFKCEPKYVLNIWTDIHIHLELLLREFFDFQSEPQNRKLIFSLWNRYVLIPTNALILNHWFSFSQLKIISKICCYCGDFRLPVGIPKTGSWSFYQETDMFLHQPMPFSENCFGKIEFQNGSECEKM